MQFPHAYKGVTKLLIGQTMTFMTSVLIAAGVLIMLAAKRNSVEDVLLGMIVLAGTALVKCVALVLEMIGLMQARKDDKTFLLAFLIAILSLFATIIKPFLSARFPVVSGWMEVSDTVARLAIIEITVSAVRSFAKQLEDAEVYFLASRMQIVITILWVFIALLTLYRITPTMLSGTAEIISYVLTAVAEILVIYFLWKARKMLKRKKEETTDS